VRDVSLPSRLEGLGSVVSSSSEVRGRDRSKTVLMHIKRRRTPVVEGKLLKIIEKSHKKKMTHFPDKGCVCTLRTLYGYATERSSRVATTRPTTRQVHVLAHGLGMTSHTQTIDPSADCMEAESEGRSSRTFKSPATMSTEDVVDSRSKVSKSSRKNSAETATEPVRAIDEQHNAR